MEMEKFPKEAPTVNQEDPKSQNLKLLREIS